jgi:hypothetical protein
MRRLAIIVICLLAVFTLINAYTGDAGTAAAEPVETDIHGPAEVD